MTDPTETWRATFATKESAEVSELTRLLLESRQAFAASQADLTRAEAETREWRRTAERHLRSLGDSANALASARYENRVMSAELASALRRLNEKEEL